MQGIAFYAELLGFLFVVIGVPAALYCLLGAFVQRDFKRIVGVLVALGIWLVVFILQLQIVPGGEVRSSQYSGVAAFMQILFFVASAVLLVSSVKTLRQQTRGPK
jgi:NADH:ubiquinone oxidoreductase subunit 2 (subunit N)